ncbi:hypothetical protein [Nitrobacter sp. 62-23]|uniref:hypothetical protein n=1 Tax=Nitrobacter sp. 62-23 TaxID=1895798 RepID=UPI0025DE108C|nr:hypothetical protein [Nitrobacter sp. 62-23]
MSNNTDSDSRSSSKANAAKRLLRDLIAAEDLIARLDATAPETCRRHRGAQKMLTGFGGVVTCIGYWRLELGAAPEGIALWEEMAAEHQAVHRGNAGG